MPDLPPPRDPAQRYLAAIHDVLGEIRDRLPERVPEKRPDGSVELREPAASAPAGGGEEPPSAEGGKGTGAAPQRRRPARSSPAGAGASKPRTGARKRATKEP